jgi:cytoskeletal protein CcmA (bactofilin family)
MANMNNIPQPPHSSHQTTTVIGPDTHIKGEMVFDSTARILGTFEGRIVAKGEVQIGEGAACKAAVEGATVIVDGTIEGDVQARERVQLNSKARVIGDVVATTLVVAEGASFHGHCRVGNDAARNGKPSTEQRAGRPAPQMSGSQPTVQAKPAEIEATLAGLEARLSGMGRREVLNGAEGQH